MKCPHCRENFWGKLTEHPIGADVRRKWWVEEATCPKCFKMHIYVKSCWAQEVRFATHDPEESSALVYPKGNTRPVPQEVEAECPDIARDFTEACVVLADSPKASAALSRRCLQNLLLTKLGVKGRDLAKQIQQVLDSKVLPAYLANDLDAVRGIGNFAAHPMKSQSTGVILDVEPGEAEWTLDILEGLFDFLFVQPGIMKAKRDALNAKLVDAGKPPVTQPPSES